jgi:hypothetical protein
MTFPSPCQAGCLTNMPVSNSAAMVSPVGG